MAHPLAVIYLREPENDSAILVFQTQAGKFFQVVFSPLTAEKMFQYTVISIRPREEEAPAEPVVPVNPVSGLIYK